MYTHYAHKVPPETDLQYLPSPKLIFNTSLSLLTNNQILNLRQNNSHEHYKHFTVTTTNTPNLLWQCKQTITNLKVNKRGRTPFLYYGFRSVNKIRPSARRCKLAYNSDFNFGARLSQS